MDDLAIITPTSDRPAAFQLCERWMARALAYYGRRVTWYVVDDGIEPARCTLGQTLIRRAPCESRVESFLGNLLAGLSAAREPKIVFIEDDDWYAADYLAVMSAELDQVEIVGEARAKYYSLPSRRFMVFPNAEHASLCQTGIRRSLVDWFSQHVTQAASPYVDMALWTTGAADRSRRLLPETHRCIGMKGLPGKVGISDGHDGTPAWDQEDRDGTVLRSWIGEEDAAVYLDLMQYPTQEIGRSRGIVD